MERLTIDEIIAHCERKVERIEKYNNGANTIEIASIDLPIVKEYWEHKQVAEYLKQLKAYKDAEEQGLLPKLKVGDTVWDNDFDRIYAYEITGYSFGTSEEYIDRPITVEEIVYYCKDLTNDAITGGFASSEIGKTVFLTKEEAEQKLAEMKGE